MSVDQLLGDFAQRRWDTNPFERLMSVASRQPSELELFVSAALERTPRGGAFVDTALSFVSEEAFGRLVSTAMTVLSASRENAAAESVIAYASLQFPRLLHRHLDELFRLRPNGDTYYENWPWREAGDVALDQLAGLVANPFNREADRSKAWSCLLETRSPEALRFAANPELDVPLPHTTDVYLREVGFASPTTPLYTAPSCHLTFAGDYFGRQRPSFMSRSSHPTWSLPSSGVECRFGGTAPGSCVLCAGRLHHLLTVPVSAIPFVEAEDDSVLTFATCLSCLGWERETLYYRHSTSGAPEAVDRGALTPRIAAAPLRGTTVNLSPTPARWSWQDWALSNSRENLSRLGGYPSFIQTAYYPDCVACRAPMRFFLQLDSHLPSEDGGEWLWGSRGICYGFWCGACRVSAFLWQCS